MRALCIAVALALALPGCIGREKFDEERPEDWRQGAVLWAYQGGKAHDADETYELRVSDASGASPESIPRPARCVAYQDGRHAVGDTCTVHGPGRDTWAGEDLRVWSIEASWDGKGQDLHEDVELNRGGRTVVAFAEDGTITAHWDGMALDPEGTFMTE